MTSLTEYGLGACELLADSESGALSAQFIAEELGLSEDKYRKLHRYLKQGGAIRARAALVGPALA